MHVVALYMHCVHLLVTHALLLPYCLALTACVQKALALPRHRSVPSEGFSTILLHESTTLSCGAFWMVTCASCILTLLVVQLAMWPQFNVTITLIQSDLDSTDTWGTVYHDTLLSIVMCWKYGYHPALVQEHLVSRCGTSYWAVTLNPFIPFNNHHWECKESICATWWKNVTKWHHRCVLC